MKLSQEKELTKAIAASSLRALPGELIDRLLEGAVVRSVAAGATTHQEGDPAFVELVVVGLLRGYVSGPSGRTMTIRYCRVGALMGTATLFNPNRPRAHGNLTALVNSRVLSLSPATVRALVERELPVTRAFLDETSARVAEYMSELEARSFGTIRQRLARHLIDLAAEQQSGTPLIAHSSQEELAAAVGTVREMVVRVLREMRDDGLVRTRRETVELLDAGRLYAETYMRRKEL
jgi:CRP/FNR family transcriptional regulator, cyclic AMP receptor protein